MLDLYEVGQRVRLLRRAAKLTQPELAKRSGVSRATIAALENGKLGELGFVKLTKILAVVGPDLRLTTANLNRPTLEDLQSGDEQ